MKKAETELRKMQINQKSDKNVCLVQRIIKLHKDKRGMSLVEVIIAITILGLVAVPVLHSMTTAMVYNQKARNRQEMTLTAESIMETFKGYDLTGDASSDTLINRFKNGAVGDTVIEGVKCKDVTHGHSGYKYDDSSAPDTHKFYIYDMLADNGQCYDVEITATSNGTVEIMEPENMEPTRDAIFIGDSKYDDEARKKAADDFVNRYKDDFVAAFGDDITEKGHDGSPYVEINGEKKEVESDLVANLNIVNYIQIDAKKLTLKVTEDSGDATYAVTAELQYTYHITDYPYYVKKAGASSRPSDAYVGEGGTEVAVEHEEEWESETLQWKVSGTGDYKTFPVDITLTDAEKNVYKNPTAAKLARLFVYYYPNYALPDKSDQIYIDNQTDIALQCCILKQRTQKFSNNRLQTEESRYNPSVSIANGEGGSCEVFHNFYDNIGGGRSTAADENSITGENIIGKYSYTKKTSGTKPEIVDKFKQSEALSYQILLEVKQDGRLITKLESTKNEKIKKKER